MPLKPEQIKSLPQYVPQLQLKMPSKQDLRQSSQLSSMSAINNALPLNRVCEIDINNLRYNISRIKALADASHYNGMFAVVKGNAYGHGVLKTMQIAAEFGIHDFGVATLGEAVFLRENGCEGRILVLGPPLPEEFSFYACHNIDLMIPSSWVAEQLITWSETTHMTIDVHFMIDTGMNRIGLEYQEAYDIISKIVQKTSTVKFVGLCTHLNDVTGDHGKEYTNVQFRRYLSVFNKLKRNGINVPLFHIENSDSLFEDAIDDEVIGQLLTAGTQGMSRTGSAIFGLAKGQKPIMTFKATVRHIQVVAAGETVGYGRKYTPEEDVLVATLSVGYADGYPKGCNLKAKVRIGTNNFLVIGMAMDMMMILLGPKDDSDAQSVNLGDWAVLWGTKQEDPNVYELAKIGGVGSVEITCGIGERVARTFVDSSDVLMHE